MRLSGTFLLSAAQSMSHFLSPPLKSEVLKST
jgi:hypothetical protein